ncbi:Cys-tRNA(Pro) deacylase [Gorillibacterium sp. sgz500922]|uniref:Cys-tRNA(Pro) deacylase n=1 Tax=Gorillibacterium sp. sgz500922 TaxID=3446694 RepID=UPI003F666BDC
MSESKTNAMRILDKAGVDYRTHAYDPNDGQIHGTAVAEKIGLPVDRVFKTLVAHHGSALYIFVIPVASELDLKKAAKAAGEKSIDMLPLKDLQKHTGYIRGGCSPVGMKKLYPTFIDSSAEALFRIAVSGGRVGLQMELAAGELAGLISARFAPLAKEEEQG